LGGDIGSQLGQLVPVAVLLGGIEVMRPEDVLFVEPLQPDHARDQPALQRFDAPGVGEVTRHLGVGSVEHAGPEAKVAGGE